MHVTSSCESFLKRVSETPVDVGVIGWVIGPCDGRFILDRLKSRKHAPRVVVYTGFESETVPVQVMAHGGAAFVSKNEQPEYLLDTIVQVAHGRMVFPYLDVSRLNANPLTTLTRRELEVLALMAAGTMSSMGSMSITVAAEASRGMRSDEVAVLLVTSVRNVTAKQINAIMINRGI